MRMIGLGLCLLVLVAASPRDLSMSTSPVADASRASDRETVRALLSDGADVNASAGDGMSALHWAAARNDTALAEMLLYAGANVKASTRLGAYTPLVLAAKNGHGSIVELLLRSGSDANEATATGSSALMFAAASGSVDAVGHLLDRGASLNAVESTGEHTPLMFASAAGRSDVVELLVARGAETALTSSVVDVPTRNNTLEDGFFKRLDDLRDARAAEEGAGPEIANTEETADGAENQESKSFFAKLFGWLKPGGKEQPSNQPRQRFSRQFGELVGVQGGMTALLFAARRGDAASVEALLKAGSDINQIAEGSRTSPLLIATMNGHFDLAASLLERGADPNLASEPAGVTPLYATINLAWAPHAMYPQPTSHKQQDLTYLQFMKVLLDHGADPNTRLKKKVWFMLYNFDTSGINEDGATPFWRAAYGSDVGAMKLLRSYGADPNIRTRKPKGRRYRVDLSKKEMDPTGLPPVPVGGPALTPLHGASGAGFGQGFAANDHRGHPAGFMPAVRYLVEECGADVNARDHEGATALHNAASRGDVEMIEYLVSKRADATLVNRKGQSTADMANGPVQRIQPFPEARDLLVSLGAMNNDNCVSC